MPAIVPFIIATGLSEGTALMLLINGPPATAIWLNHILVGFIVFRVWAWINYRRKLTAAKAPQAALSTLLAANPLFQLAGNLLPVLLIGAAFAAKGLPALLFTTACALIVLSGWYIKFIIVTRAAHVQGFALGTPAKAAVKV